MKFNNQNSTLSAKCIGYRVNEGEFNNVKYHNYILTLSQSYSEGEGKGFSCFEMTLPDSVGVHPDRILNRDIIVSFNYYKDLKRQKILSLKYAG